MIYGGLGGLLSPSSLADWIGVLSSFDGLAGESIVQAWVLDMDSPI